MKWNFFKENKKYNFSSGGTSNSLPSNHSGLQDFHPVRWDKLIVDQDGGKFQQYHNEITPSNEEWKEFWFMMDEIEIWDCYSEYNAMSL